MMKTGKVAMKIDSVRVYQSKDDDAHGGQPHSLGCDPEEFPTKEYIKGFQYRYMRPNPFGLNDKHPLKKLKNGWGSCVVDEDCGGGGVENTVVDESWHQPNGNAKRKKSSESAYEQKKKKHAKVVHDREDVLDLDEEDSKIKNRRLFNIEDDDDSTSDEEYDLSKLDKPQQSKEALVDEGGEEKVLSNPDRKPKGECVKAATKGLFGLASSTGKQCKCNQGYTGPNCLSIEKFDDEKGAYETKLAKVFENMANPHLTSFHLFLGGSLAVAFILALVMDIGRKDRATELTNRRS